MCASRSALRTGRGGTGAERGDANTSAPTSVFSFIAGAETVITGLGCVLIAGLVRPSLDCV